MTLDKSTLGQLLQDNIECFINTTFSRSDAHIKALGRPTRTPEEAGREKNVSVDMWNVLAWEISCTPWSARLLNEHIVGLGAGMLKVTHAARWLTSIFSWLTSERRCTRKLTVNYSLYEAATYEPYFPLHLGDPGSIPGRVTPDFHMWENRAGRYRWSAGFLRDLQFPPPLHSGAAPYSPQSSSSTLKASIISAPLVTKWIVDGPPTECGGKGNVNSPRKPTAKGTTYTSPICGDNSVVMIRYHRLQFGCRQKDRNNLRLNVSSTERKSEAHQVAQTSRNEETISHGLNLHEVEEWGGGGLVPDDTVDWRGLPSGTAPYSPQLPSSALKTSTHSALPAINHFFNNANRFFESVKYGIDPRGTPASKVKKRGSDTGDTNTHFLRLIAPTRTTCSVSARFRRCDDKRFVRNCIAVGTMPQNTSHLSPPHLQACQSPLRLAQSITRHWQEQLTSNLSNHGHHARHHDHRHRYCIVTVTSTAVTAVSLYFSSLDTAYCVKYCCSRYFAGCGAIWLVGYQALFSGSTALCLVHIHADHAKQTDQAELMAVLMTNDKSSCIAREDPGVDQDGRFRNQIARLESVESEISLSVLEHSSTQDLARLQGEDRPQWTLCPSAVCWARKSARRGGGGEQVVKATPPTLQ
ncbi:hypothetical protein PR048_020494 [Dryococelus australis]|uniref:Uncharacterized protein n=1 Tax=Dryococelus australis TaxID=614101 RepID=A0ABQ9H6I1_9NEOP|nr:hypothetical protein PR048_020494 [Dryococelus australis]